MNAYAEPGELQAIGPRVELANAHVLVYYRWHIWLASKMGRLFHATMLTQWHNEELACAQSIETAAARCAGGEPG